MWNVSKAKGRPLYLFTVAREWRVERGEPAIEAQKKGMAGCPALAGAAAAAVGVQEGANAGR